MQHIYGIELRSNKDYSNGFTIYNLWLKEEEFINIKNNNNFNYKYVEFTNSKTVYFLLWTADDEEYLKCHNHYSKIKVKNFLG
jgi:hypothetical protein